MYSFSFSEIITFQDYDISNGPFFGKLRSSTRNKYIPKSFTCIECSYTTSRLDNFRRHELVHSGDRPFKCAYCSKSFTQKSHLKKHAQTHYH